MIAMQELNIGKAVARCLPSVRRSSSAETRQPGTSLSPPCYWQEIHAVRPVPAAYFEDEEEGARSRLPSSTGSTIATTRPMSG